MSEAFRARKKYAEVHGRKMAYIDEGKGDPIVFLHGNPTSSYLWRDVMPALEGMGRLIAPDLIGMGDSDKLETSGPDSYRFVEHKKYLFELLEQLGVHSNVTLVIHDWGSALGFHWAHSHKDRLKGIAFMEAIVAPVPDRSHLPNAFGKFLDTVRSPAGEEFILQQNAFVEGMLPASIMRKLTDEEMTEYRRPFAKAGEDRRPTLTWPREIPIEGEPADVHKIVSDYAAWLPTSADLPKLFIDADPGALLRGAAREQAKSWPNTTHRTVKGIHFIQEDSGAEIGRHIGEWLNAIG